MSRRKSLIKAISIVICLILVLLLLSSCGITQGDLDQSVASSQTVNNSNGNMIPPPDEIFQEKFLFDTFEQLSAEFKQQGVDRFIAKTDKYNTTESQIHQRRQEVSNVFSEFTYIPYYNGKQGVIDRGLYVEIPSNIINSFDGSYSYTAFEYVVAFETEDGFDKNYAYVYAVHGKEHKDYLWKDLQEYDGKFIDLYGHVNYAQTELDGKTVEYAVGNNLTYFFDYDEETLIVISFRIKEALSEGIVKSQYSDWGLSAELENASWLSKLSFQKIEFDTEFQLEYLSND